MRRAYNPNLSSKVNAQLSKRARVVQVHKYMLAFSLVIIISVLVILGSAIKAFAGTGHESLPQYKYYTSIQVESGDTVWSIAEEYTHNTDVSVQDYVNEVCNLNHLNQGMIHSGETLVVAYYSTELQ